LKDFFDTIQDFYVSFCEDTELTALLGTAPSDFAECNQRIRRSFSDPTRITPEGMPFMDMAYIDANGETGNHLVLRSPIEFNVYCESFDSAMVIYKVIRRIIKDKFKELTVNGGHQRSTPLSGTFCWSFRVRTLVSS
jgi:hypothetical protein